jgi:hypothetical protein
MNICWRRHVLLALALSSCVGSHLAAQTTVVQNPNGGTAQVTIQGDGTGNTVIFTQSVTGGPAPAGGAPQGAAGGVVFGSGVGVAVDGAMTLPPRDQQAAPATGTSRIRGRVVASDSGRPIRRAVVRLASPAIRESRTTSTDQDGQFEFAQLPASQYNVSASKNGFVQMGIQADAAERTPAASHPRRARGCRAVSTSHCRPAASSRAGSSTNSASRSQTCSSRHSGNST